MALLYCHLTASSLRKAACWQRQFLYLPLAVFYSSYASGAKQMTETNNLNQT